MDVMATEPDIREALRQVLDPEIGVNIVDLGLVYRIEVDGARVRIAMTMTSPACPLADYLKDLVTSLCSNAVTVTKQVQSPTTGLYSTADGWEMEGNLTFDPFDVLIGIGVFGWRRAGYRCCSSACCRWPAARGSDSCASGGTSRCGGRTS